MQSRGGLFKQFFSFHPRHQPYMVRHSYRHEMRSAMTFPLAASLAEGAFTGVVAAKNFNANEWLIALITAAPMFGNIAAIFWAELSRGRRKVPMVNFLQLGVVLLIASVALTALVPKPIGAWIFAAQIILARLIASGIITIRSTIWRANYPSEVRGQIAGRIAATATLVLAIATLGGSALLDHDPTTYVYLYPAAALLGLIGIWQFSGIRVRREISLRKREEQVYAPRPESMSQTDEANVLNYQPGRGHRRSLRKWVTSIFQDAFQVLRDDPLFRKYQRYQFMSGFAFMMFAPSLVVMVSKEMTDPVKQYLLSTVLLQVIPQILLLLFTPIWSPLFDKVHILKFRVIHGIVSISAIVLLLIGAMITSIPHALVVIAVAQAVVGVSMSGGNLAWSLGHMDFTTADRASKYMGVHVMLTGLRGCMAPFVGAGLYRYVIGRWVFAVSLGLCILAVIGFWTLSRHAPSKREHATAAVGRKKPALQKVG